MLGKVINVVWVLLSEKIIGSIYFVQLGQIPVGKKF